MATPKKPETTSPKVATVAGKVLSAGKATPKQAMTLAASALCTTSSTHVNGAISPQTAPQSTM